MKHIFALLLAPSLLLAQQPNILLIMADDVDAEAFQAYATNPVNSADGGAIATPNIETLTSQGVRFTNAFTAPLCTPTRCMLLTGQSNLRNYRAFGYLDNDQTTFAQVLRDNGYSTAIAGKWQLSEPDGNTPITPSGTIAPNITPAILRNDYGFDSYLLWQLNHTRSKRGSRYWQPKLETTSDDGLSSVLVSTSPTDYGPDLFTAHLKDFITDSTASDTPFLAYYSMAIPHDPWVSTPTAPGATTGDNATYFDENIEYLDTLVGQLLDHLDDPDGNPATNDGIRENTIVIFTADNGTSPRVTINNTDRGNVPGDKGTASYDGTHVPLIIDWGSKMPPEVSNRMTDLSDVFPTLLTVAGISPPAGHPIDGEAIIDATGAVQANKDTIFIWYDPLGRAFTPAQFAQNTQYKLYGDKRFYDIVNDRFETTNLNNGNLTANEQSNFDALNAVLASHADDIADRSLAPRFAATHWAQVPQTSTSQGSVTMTAGIAEDASSPIEYQFKNATMNSTGIWQTDRTYTSFASGTNQYQYRTRDLFGNTSAWSDMAEVTIPSTPSTQSQPNIIVMLMDDMGVNDIGAYTYPSKAIPGPPPETVSGGTGTIDIPPPNPAYDASAVNLSITPRIDSIADDGVRFTQFYSTHSVCTPTRASLMTGSYAARIGLENVVGPYNDTNRSNRGLNSTEVTLPELLRTVGYATGMSGKWHLGHDKDFSPVRHGFENYFGILYSNDMWEPNANQSWGPLNLMHGETALSSYTTNTGYTIANPIDTDSEQSYLLEALTEKAIDFIDTSMASKQPFFLYYAPHTPHVPIHPHPDYVSVVSESDPIARYYDLIKEIDARVGEILDRLVFHGIENDTIIIFTSDNGPSQSITRVQAGEVPGGGGSAYPFRGRKGLSEEGGHRVPFLARFTGQIPTGAVRNELGVTFDLFTTLVNLAGAEIPTDRVIDGEDIWPLLTGNDTREIHDAYYYYRSGATNAHAVIDLNTINKWKYTEISGASGKLFKIGDGFTEDFQETFDVGGSNPSTKSTLKTQMDNWNSTLSRRETGWKRPIQIEVEADSVTVDENGTAITRIRLSDRATKTIHVGRFSGDSSLDVTSGATINFNSGNWNIWQTVTFDFAPDVDTENGAAVFRAYGNSIGSSADIHVREIFVYENDTMQAITQIPPPDKPLLLRYKLDETSGTFIDDSSTQNNHGFLAGVSTTSWNMGYLNGALSFDGSANAYCDLTAAIPAIDNTGLSASGWVYLEAYGTTQNRWILQQFDGGGTGRTWLAVQPDGTLYSFIGNGPTSGGQISLNHWHHVAVTAGRGSVRLYIDGSHIATSALAIEDNTSQFRFANHKNLDLAKQWIGALDDLRIYSGVLDAKQIEWLAARTAPVVVSAPSLQKDNDNDYLALTYTQLSGGTGTVGSDYTIDGISYIIETNENLSSTWNSGLSYTVPVGPPIPVDPLQEQVNVRLTNPLSLGNNQFIRLKVVEP